MQIERMMDWKRGNCVITGTYGVSWELKNDQTRSETPRCYNLPVASALVWWACAGAVIECPTTKSKVHGSNLRLGS